MEKYNPKSIENKWQKFWEENKTFFVYEDLDKQKFYGLIEFPYPSGAGLHVGHLRSYTAMDVICRQKRMEDYNVLYPIGFDSFGLPTENFAIKTGRQPAEITAENIATFTKQLKNIGFSFDWDRVVTTSEPEYYKWTQWIFLQMFKHGLAYKSNQPINWCLNCKIGLANEEVVNGRCERCGGPIEKRDKDQWMLAITKYADKLLAGLKKVDYIERAKVQQENWIGRSEGALVRFIVPCNTCATRPKNSPIGCADDSSLEVFTTRPDTLFGATYLVVAPEHELIINHKLEIINLAEVEKYVAQAKRKTDLERTTLDKEKTGVELKGIEAVNPVNGESIPIWVADYVLGGYGVGAIMAVPAHDERDFEFAQKFGLLIKEVVVNNVTINSDFLNGLDTHEAKEKIIQWLEEKGIGKRQVNYKLRDWVFSRQRYWGEPIPLVFCETCKNKKYSYILLHGFTGNSKINFFPWLKTELEKQGHNVFCPDLPNSDEPNIEEQTKFVLESGAMDENIILVGHSLGGVVAMNVAQKLTGKVAKLVLVDSFIRPEFTDKSRPNVEKSFGWQFDFEKIKNNIIQEIVVLADQDFVVIPEAQSEEMRELLEASLRWVKPNDRHFSNKEEPEIARTLVQSGWIPLSEDQLPLELPIVEKYQPTDTGESPLAAMTDWVNTVCPRCGGPARRETDTMPNWAGSSWYFLAYTLKIQNSKFRSDPRVDKIQNYWNKDLLKYWMPVDWYNGGMEHTVLHLLYSRFWNQFLYDIGVAPTMEPYKKRTAHGMILASDGQKMSKSLGNVVNPDKMAEQFGADVLRVYILFMGPFDQAVAWDTNGLIGVRRFLDRVWNLQEKIQNQKSEIINYKSKIQVRLHQTIKKVTEDINNMRFNTAVAKMMELSNEMLKQETISQTDYTLFIKLLSPFAPHLAEELWSKLENNGSIALESWPTYNPELATEEEMTIVIQVNSKIRDQLVVPVEISEEEVKKLALESEKVRKWLQESQPKKIIYVKNKLVSIVV